MIDKLIAALLSIREQAMQHPAFDAKAFEARDIEALMEEGGDVSDWTMIAIQADDAIKEAE